MEASAKESALGKGRDGTLGGRGAGAGGTEESCKATHGGEADRSERVPEEGPQPGYQLREAGSQIRQRRRHVKLGQKLHDAACPPSHQPAMNVATMPHKIAPNLTSRTSGVTKGNRGYLWRD